MAVPREGDKYEENGTKDTYKVTSVDARTIELETSDGIYASVTPDQLNKFYRKK